MHPELAILHGELPPRHPKSKAAQKAADSKGKVPCCEIQKANVVNQRAEI